MASLRKRTRRLFLPVLLLWLAAAAPATAGKQDEAEVVPPKRTVPAADAQVQLVIYDPWEGWNRRVYAFNTQFDRYIFLPAVRGYETITPDPLEKGVTNFFHNVGEVRTCVHSILQAKPRAMGVTLARLIVNTSLGIGGLFDPATDMGLVRRNEDFGQTLGRWGVGDGPSTVLPIFGPSNLRDTGGMLGDYALELIAYEAIGLNGSDQFPLRATLTTLRALDMRANLGFRYYESGSPFEYELIRYLYTKLREVEIAK